MPSLLPGYEYDIFISYRHKDNKSDGWVTEFVRTLRSELEATFKEDISIYFDENPHDGLLQHHEVDDSLREKLRCLVFIPIVSQTYCDPKAFAWQHELLAFIKLASEDMLGLKTKVAGGNTASRVLPVRIHEVDAQDKKLFEEATGGILRPIDFIYKEAGVNRPLRPTDNRERNQVQTDYRNQVNKVANAIKDIIAGLKGAESGTTQTVKDHVPATSDQPFQPSTRRSLPLRRPRVSPLFVLFLVTLIALITLGLLHFSESIPESRTIRSALLPPDKSRFSTEIGSHFALSPDGRSLAFVAIDSAGKSFLWVRQLDALSAQRIAGTDNATFPFWSPDNRFVGFFAGGRLKVVESSGGALRTVCEVPDGRGGAWSKNGTILFCPSGGTFPLYAAPASGGQSYVFSKLDSSRNETSHRWPFFLPDGMHFLYAVRTTSGASAEEDAIFVGSLDSTFISRRITYSSSSVAFSNGHLIYARDQTLMAQPFDLQRLETTGEAMPIAEKVYHESLTGKTSFSVSQQGTLVYQTGSGSAGVQLHWYDRSGRLTGALTEPSFYNDIRLAPDGKRAAISRLDTKTKNTDIWIYEIERNVWTRFTFDLSTERWPIWSPDGSTIIYSSSQQGKKRDLFQKVASGAKSEELLLESAKDKIPSDWSRDGRFIAYTLWNTTSAAAVNDDIWIQPLGSARDATRQESFPFLQSKFNESRATFSPDGRWIAYQSDESGRYEIYIRPFPGPGGKWQASTGGGSRPRWRGDGKELFYLNPNDKMMAVQIQPGYTTMEFGKTQALFEFRPFTGVHRDVFDVTADGEHFLVTALGSLHVSSPLTLVANWTEEIEKLSAISKK